jgi:hypothetical protein
VEILALVDRTVWPKAVHVLVVQALLLENRTYV